MNPYFDFDLSEPGRPRTETSPGEVAMAEEWWTEEGSVQSAYLSYTFGGFTNPLNLGYQGSTAAAGLRTGVYASVGSAVFYELFIGTLIFGGIMTFFDPEDKYEGGFLGSPESLRWITGESRVEMFNQNFMLGAPGYV